MVSAIWTRFLCHFQNGASHFCTSKTGKVMSDLLILTQFRKVNFKWFHLSFFNSNRSSKSSLRFPMGMSINGQWPQLISKSWEIRGTLMFILTVVILAKEKNKVVFLWFVELDKFQHAGFLHIMNMYNWCTCWNCLLITNWK